MANKNAPAATEATSKTELSSDIISQLPENWRYAIAYVCRGWAVFPCRGKVPMTAHGYKDATCNVEQILAWARQYPNANVAIATGQESNLLVVDADDILAVKLLEERDLVTQTVLSQTDRGFHYLYRMPPGVNIGCKVGLLPSVDIRGTGGYIIAPPSLHESGKRYSFVYGCRPDQVEIAEAPTELVELILHGDSASASTDSASFNHYAVGLQEIATGGIAEHDGRNHAATRLFGHLLRRYVDVMVATVLMQHWNATNLPPLKERELQKIMESVSGRELARRRGNGAHNEAHNE